MAASRIENFKEYRKAIISDDTQFSKTPIETSLKVTSPSGNVIPTEEEALFLKRIKVWDAFKLCLFLLILFGAITTLIIFGIKLF